MKTVEKGCKQIRPVRDFSRNGSCAMEFPSVRAPVESFCSLGQNDLNDSPSLRQCCFYWSRDQVQPGSLSFDDKGGKEREPGFKVDKKLEKLPKLEISERSVLGVRMGK